MELLSSIRWNDVLGSLFQDTGCHVLLGMFLLLLLTGCLCCRLYDAAPVTEQTVPEHEFSAHESGLDLTQTVVAVDAARQAVEKIHCAGL